MSPRSARRLVDRADGWLPAAQGAARLTEEWTRVKKLAEERGRTRPMQVCVRVSAHHTAKP